MPNSTYLVLVLKKSAKTAFVPLALATTTAVCGGRIFHFAAFCQRISRTRVGQNVLARTIV